MKKVDLLPNSLVSGVMTFLSETQDAPVSSLSNKQFLEAYKGLIAQKRLSYTDPRAEGSEFRRVECLQFDPSVDFAEKNLSRFLGVKELQFLNGYKHSFRILCQKTLPRDTILQISLAAPGLLMGDTDTLYLLKFPRLRRLEILGSNKHQPKKLSELLQNLCIFTKLLYLRLESFPLDGTINVPYSLTLKHLRLDLVGTFFDFNLLNIFFPVLQELELYYSQDPSGHPVTGTLRVLNFPNLKDLTLKNLRPLSNIVRDPFAEKISFFLIF
ncbi:hypothetical protein DSO57_1032631 [Entomophthora muscae]|uniref:Uncharacterized protein n=1 Tax=Entomophthora muscae TaxID=34485 RepID=A0ACC2T0J6_9FUNG|nr:hypothetical protein DSO57_1032631 [Entomophthora muscae]